MFSKNNEFTISQRTCSKTIMLPQEGKNSDIILAFSKHVCHRSPKPADMTVSQSKLSKKPQVSLEGKMINKEIYVSGRAHSIKPNLIDELFRIEYFRSYKRFLR